MHRGVGWSGHKGFRYLPNICSCLGFCRWRFERTPGFWQSSPTSGSLGPSGILCLQVLKLDPRDNRWLLGILLLPRLFCSLCNRHSQGANGPYNWAFLLARWLHYTFR